MTTTPSTGHLVKFSDPSDKLLFCVEESLDYDGSAEPVSVPEEAILKRNHEREKIKDLKKSTTAKKAWRTKGRNMSRGIAKFHRSSKGKQFHRKLGRLLATRDFKDKQNEWLIAVNSMLTHLAIEEQFASSIDVEAEVQLLKESAFELLSPLIHRLVMREEISPDEVLEEISLMNTLVNHPYLGEDTADDRY